MTNMQMYLACYRHYEQEQIIQGSTLWRPSRSAACNHCDVIPKVLLLWRGLLLRLKCCLVIMFSLGVHVLWILIWLQWRPLGIHVTKKHRKRCQAIFLQPAPPPPKKKSKYCVDTSPFSCLRLCYSVDRCSVLLEYFGFPCSNLL